MEATLAKCCYVDSVMNDQIKAKITDDSWILDEPTWIKQSRMISTAL